MKTIVLRTAAEFLISLLLLYAVYLLIRGHNLPGGGFIAGLVASGAWALHAIAFDVAASRRTLFGNPPLLIGSGLIIALVSGLIPVFDGKVFMTGRWFEVELGEGTKLALGTPLLFDAGVFLVVMGAVLTVLFGMEEEH